MILDQLYTTDLTSGNLQLTARIENIPIDTEDFTPAYWLGWMKNTNLPQIFYVSKMTIDGSGDNAVLSFTDATDWSVNRDIGYMGQTDNSSGYANPMHMVYCRYDSTAAKWVVDFTGNNKFARLINNMRYQEFSYKYIILTFGWAVYGVNSSGSVSGSTVTLTIDQLIDFVNGDYDISLTVSNYSVTLNISDFNDNYIAYVGDNNDIPLCIVAYEFQKYLYSTNYTQYANIIPMVSVPYNDDDNDVTDIKCCDWSTPHDIASTNIVSIKNLGITNEVLNSTGISLNGTTDFDAPRYLNGAYGTFTVQELNGMTTSTPPVVSGNMIAVRRDYWGNSFYSFAVALNPSLILKHAGLFRWGTHNSNYNVAGYNANDIYYPEVILSTNEFTGNLLTGDEAYVKPRIPIWMKYEVTENDYNPADKPAPEPPEPADDEEIGSTINRPTTLGVGGTLGFVTQYSLTATQVAALGRILWTSFLDPDYYKNFLFSLALDTGSFNMSSLLTYFISLRVYPFPLINVPSHAAAGSSMFVGAGTVPLAFSDTLHTINNYADYIDAGSLVVPRHYNDFRDYTDAEYMVYLPYCGTVQLNPGDVVGNTLSAQYAIDFATGACIAYVDLRTGDGHGYPIAALPGHIGADVPLTATNAGQVAAMLAGDAMHIAQTIGNVPATQISSGVAGFAAADTGNLAGAANSLIRSWTAPVTAAGQYAQHLATMATRPAIGIPMLSGGRGFGAFGAPQTAYLQIRRGLYKQPGNYAHTVGYASTVAKKIGEVQGLITAYVDTSTLSATADEAAEITTLLKSGVIV